MGEPRDFYYPLQDDASDIDRVVHDLVEITDTEESVNNYVKIINVEGQPHFSFGPVEDGKPIEVKDWEIPIGDGNDWVKKSDFYITTNKEQFSKDKTTFGEEYHDWGRSSSPRGSVTVTITQPDIEGSYNFTPSWTITDLKIDGQDFNLSFSDISGFYSIQGQLLSGENYSTHNLFSLNFNNYTLADRLFFDSDYSQINTNDPDFNTKFTWGGVIFRLRSNGSARGVLLFHKDGYIFLCGNFSEPSLQFYLQKYHVSNSINTVDIKINTKSMGYKTGVSDLGIAEYSTVDGGGLISINFLALCPKEVAIGTYGEAASLFFGFNVGAKVGAAEGPYTGGIMLKDSQSTFHLEGDSLLHLRKKSGVLFDNSCVIMNGSPSVVYEGPAPKHTSYGTRNPGSTWISNPNGPVLDMKDKTLLQLGGKSEIDLDEGAQIKASGRSSLNLQGTPEVNISGSPTIHVYGNQAPGKISGKFQFSLSGYGTSTIQLSFIPKDQNEVNEFMNIGIGDTGEYQFLLDIYNREGGYISYIYPTTAPRASAQVINIMDRNNSLRANGTSHVSSNYCTYDQAKYFHGDTGGQGGNRQAYIMINGGSTVTMQPGPKADPCFLVNGASTILMNNSASPKYNDYENYYVDYHDDYYNCSKAANGYGPLALFQEDRFYYAGFGSTGAGNDGAPVLADDLTFAKSSLIRNTMLEEIIKEVKTKGYADYTAQRNGIIYTVWSIGKKNNEDVESNYFRIENNEKIYLYPNFYKIIGYYYCVYYTGQQEQKFFAGNSIVYLGGESGSNSYIRIGANPGEFTEVNILDNSYIETKMNSTLCIRGRDLDNYSWLDIPEDNGGTNIHVLDSATFVMRGVWDDSQVALEDKIPQGADHLIRKNNTTLFEMTDNAEFRMQDSSYLKIDSNGVTISDGTTTITFTVAELAAALAAGALSNAEQVPF